MPFCGCHSLELVEEGLREVVVALIMLLIRKCEKKAILDDTHRTLLVHDDIVDIDLMVEVCKRIGEFMADCVELGRRWASVDAPYLRESMTQ